MTTRADVERLRLAQMRLIELARRELEQAFFSLNLTSPERVRDALLQIVPALVEKYGDVAATVAAEWYEEVRAREVGGRFAATLGDTFDEARVQAAVRREVGHLWTAEQAQALTAISGSIQRFILYSGRDTVARNIRRDRARPRWGRVPTGAKTCAFCSLMASRGFVYLSEVTAGMGNDFHNDCDCQIVAEWDATEHHIAGYDPDLMYSRYLEARAAVGNTSDQSAILAEMRRMYPDDFTDGVVSI